LHLAYILHDYIFGGLELHKRVEMSMTQVQVNYQTKEQYIIANILKYGSINLIIFFHCIYSRLLETVELSFRTLWDKENVNIGWYVTWEKN